MLSEEQEGRDAYWNGKSVEDNPYIWSNHTWWMVEARDEGWNGAEEEDYD